MNSRRLSAALFTAICLFTGPLPLLGQTLEIQTEPDRLVLRFAVPSPIGSVKILASDRIEALLSSGTILQFEPVPDSGVGALVITNYAANQQQFFAALWIQEIPSPTPAQWQWVRDGVFQMGSSAAEIDREDDEGPVNWTAITRGFLIGRHEVTQAEYAAVMANNPSVQQGDPQLPVENVTWSEAVEYCQRLTEQERAAGHLSQKYAYRLPTEAEWEYAARDGAQTRFFFGDDPDYTLLPEYAWFDQNSGATSHPVAQKKPSSSGLYDVYGNVAEWCADWYGPYLGGQEFDPAGPNRGEDHVIRGGSCLDEGQFCRSAFRLFDWSTNRFEDVGFRVVLAFAAPAENPSGEVQLVEVKQGTFVMGSPGPVDPTESDEVPQSQVTFPRGFSISRYEISQAQYLAVMGLNPSWFNTGQLNRPVEQVSWFDAMEYCQQLTQREQLAGRLPAGFAYRLPTEAEWEYAARAGTSTRFFFGDDEGALGEYAWFFTDGMTFGVGAKKANAWGLYDIYGNVFEWCLDWYAEYAGGRVAEPAGPNTGLYKTMRGGSYMDDPEFCRSSFRMYDIPTNRFENVGFRVVLASTNSLPAELVELVRIERQVFLMGSPAAEADRQFDEGPAFEVTLDYPFWMGKYEVTQRQFADLMGTSPSYYGGPSNRPVERVSWFDAVEFCTKLTAREKDAARLPDGYEYRLPTEAEWECAARAGSTNRFSYGDDPDYAQLGEYAWFEAAPTRGTGAKQPNAWGFYDLYGNVSEWCVDWYGPYPDRKQINPRGPQTGTWKVQRGGGVADDGKYCRSAFRGGAWPEDKDSTSGFRVVLAPVPSAAQVQPLELVKVEPGKFVMGSDGLNDLGAENERPATLVTISQAFSIGTFEVTQAQYLDLMGTNVSHYLYYADQPVENVSWDDAQSFCAALTQREASAGRLPSGQVYRLPTEAEWEYACRAGSNSRYSFGDDSETLGQYAWYVNNGDLHPHIVGSKAPNSFGIYDLHGNVAEWCADWYEPYSGGELLDPTGPSSGQTKVIRGGSHSDSATRCRSAARQFAAPSTYSGTVGFRVVLGRALGL